MKSFLKKKMFVAICFFFRIVGAPFHNMSMFVLCMLYIFHKYCLSVEKRNKEEQKKNNSNTNIECFNIECHNSLFVLDYSLTS